MNGSPSLLTLKAGNKVTHRIAHVGNLCKRIVMIDVLFAVHHIFDGFLAYAQVHAIGMQIFNILQELLELKVLVKNMR